MTGTLFDIQRFSVHDGPGIRTTVFMKGCSLRCAWCHNPGGLRRERQLQYFSEKCIGCGSCGERSSLSDAAKCPAEALKICGMIMDEEQVLREILKDKLFYANTGGVTFSGGECLLQADFAAAVLARAKEQGIHTAIDTAGLVPWSEIEKTLPACDLYLYDIKCMDSAMHKKYTGADNALILENIRKLSATGKDIWVRVPVIPDFNDRPEEMAAIADFIATLPPVRQTTLMPYHTLGRSKYETLGLQCPYVTDQRIQEQTLASFREIFRRRNLILA